MDVETLKKMFKEKASDINLFVPFYHGTDSESSKMVEQQGLKPRCKSGVQSTWTGEFAGKTLCSQDDLIYFAACNNDIPRVAARNAATRQERLHENALEESREKLLKGLPVSKEEKVLLEKCYGELNSSPTQDEMKHYSIPKRCVPKVDYAYFIIKNAEKYAKNMVKDEDENIRYVLANSIYNDQVDMQDKPASINEYEMPIRTPKPLLDILDVLWAKCGYKCVRETLLDLPDVTKSLLSSESVAITTNIPPEDLERKKDWNRDCTIKSGYNKDSRENELRYNLAQSLNNKLKYKKLGRKLMLPEFFWNMTLEPSVSSKMSARMTEENMAQLEKIYDANRAKVEAMSNKEYEELLDNLVEQRKKEFQDYILKTKLPDIESFKHSP